MSMKAIFFDYDGVLTTDRTGSLTTCRHLSDRTGIPYEAVAAAFEPHNTPLNAGLCSYATIWDSVCDALGQNVPREFLVAAFESTPLNMAMLELARGLSRSYAVGIITDNKADRFEHLVRYQALDKVFFPIVVSSVFGSSKQSPEIFEHALAHLRVAPGDAVFIDNSPKNLLAASSLGMATIHFDDERNDVEGLAVLLRERHGISAQPSVFPPRHSGASR